MRCKACNRILEDFELTRQDQHGNFIEICSICHTATNVEAMEFDPNGSLTNGDDYDTLY
jgi:hypothetical protein